METHLISFSKRLEGYQYLCVVDFEATCEAPESIPFENYPHEIIEFPVVLLNLRTFKIESEFHAFVRPNFFPELSKFCKELTGIQQHQVDRAHFLGNVLIQLDNWIRSCRLLSNGEPKFAFASHGPDLNTFLKINCDRLSIPFPHYCREWMDLRATFSHFFKTKPCGISAMMSLLGMQFVGREHSGIDDARNLAKIAEAMMKAGCEKGVFQSFDMPVDKGIVVLGPSPFCGKFLKKDFFMLKRSIKKIEKAMKAYFDHVHLRNYTQYTVSGTPEELQSLQVTIWSDLVCADHLLCIKSAKSLSVNYTAAKSVYLEAMYDPYELVQPSATFERAAFQGTIADIGALLRGLQFAEPPNKKKVHVTVCLLKGRHWREQVIFKGLFVAPVVPSTKPKHQFPHAVKGLKRFFTDCTPPPADSPSLDWNLWIQRLRQKKKELQATKKKFIRGMKQKRMFHESLKSSRGEELEDDFDVEDDDEEVHSEAATLSEEQLRAELGQLSLEIELLRDQIARGELTSKKQQQVPAYYPQQARQPYYPSRQQYGHPPSLVYKQINSPMFVMPQVNYINCNIQYRPGSYFL